MKAENAFPIWLANLNSVRLSSLSLERDHDDHVSMKLLAIQRCQSQANADSAPVADVALVRHSTASPPAHFFNRMQMINSARFLFDMADTIQRGQCPPLDNSNGFFPSLSSASHEISISSSHQQSRFIPILDQCLNYYFISMPCPIPIHFTSSILVSSQALPASWLTASYRFDSNQSALATQVNNRSREQ